MTSESSVRDYLSSHPDATATELAFGLGISVQQARRHMAGVFRAERAVGSPGPATDAAWLAGLFHDGLVMDVYRAAEYLGIDRGSVEYAVTRKKLSCVQVRGKKLFTRADLDAYSRDRGIGSRSRLVASAVVHEV